MRLNMRLTEAPVSTKLKVVNINSGLESKRRLLNLGIQTGDLLEKQNTTKWGPILVQNLTSSSSKVAIGKGLADSIEVETA